MSAMPRPEHDPSTRTPLRPVPDPRERVRRVTPEDVGRWFVYFIVALVGVIVAGLLAKLAISVWTL